MSKLILAVDDEQDILDSIAERLEANGYQVATATNGEAAMEQVKVQKPDLILLDIMMPVMDGVKFFQVLKNEPGYEDVPVIFLTALVTKEEEQNLLSRIGDDASIRMLAKPFEANKITETIEETLSA